MTRQVYIVQEDDWYVATDILSNVASQGRTQEEALSNLKEALELYYDDPTEAITPQRVTYTTLEVAI